MKIEKHGCVSTAAMAALPTCIKFLYSTCFPGMSSRQMKILLVNPPVENILIGNNPEVLDEERGFNPPLGLLYLATYLKKFSDHEVRILDCPPENVGFNSLAAFARDFHPDVTGLTAMSFTLLDVMESIRVIRREIPSCRIVLGGPHPHLFPHETMELPGVDFVIMGEGERPFAELLATDLEDEKSLGKVKGLVWRDGSGAIRTNPLPELIRSLDEIPHPDRTLTPFRKYSSLMARRSPVTTMITSRGCPYGCTFCDRPHLGKLFRAHSAAYVVDEMKAIAALGIQEILVYDDTFTIDRTRVLEICDLITRDRLKISFDIRARVNTVDEIMLRALKRAGCERIHFGVEAGTPEMLKVLNKGITLDEVEAAFRMARRAGIRTLAYFMIGNPGETREQVYQSLDFMKKIDPDFAHVTILTPFPGTKIYSEAMNRGIIKDDPWRRFAEKPDPLFAPAYWEEHLKRPELQALIRKAYQGFYTRPWYIMKQLFMVRSVGEFRRKVHAGLRVLFMR